MDKNAMRERIARRVAKELHKGDLVNLGIGLPTQVANYVTEDLGVIFQSENGLVGLGPMYRRRFNQRWRSAGHRCTRCGVFR